MYIGTYSPCVAVSLTLRCHYIIITRIHYAPPSKKMVSCRKQASFHIAGFASALLATKSIQVYPRPSNSPDLIRSRTFEDHKSQWLFNFCRCSKIINKAGRTMKQPRKITKRAPEGTSSRPSKQHNRRPVAYLGVEMLQANEPSHGPLNRVSIPTRCVTVCRK